MKKITAISVVSLLLLASCGGKGKDAASMDYGLGRSKRGNILLQHKHRHHQENGGHGRDLQDYRLYAEKR